MWIQLLGIAGALLMVDGLVLIFFPHRVRALLKRMFGEDVSELIQGRFGRILAAVEIAGGAFLLSTAMLLKYS